MSFPPPQTPSGWPPPPMPGEAPLEYPPPPARDDVGNHPKAVASLVCGLIGLVVAGVILGVIAIVLGSMARRELAASPGRWRGEGLATAGIVLGIVDIVAGIALTAYVLS